MAELTYGFGFTGDGPVRLHPRVQVLELPASKCGPCFVIQQPHSAPEHQRGGHLACLRAVGAVKEREEQ